MAGPRVPGLAGIVRALADTDAAIAAAAPPPSNGPLVFTVRGGPPTVGPDYPSLVVAPPADGIADGVDYGWPQPPAGAVSRDEPGWRRLRR